VREAWLTKNAYLLIANDDFQLAQAA